MTSYEHLATLELRAWQRKMTRRPGPFDWLAYRTQARINGFIPERIHQVLTAVIEKFTRAVLFGSGYVPPAAPPATESLADREALMQKRLTHYRHAAAAEGGMTGLGGFWLWLADFPLLLGIKLKFLFDVAVLYGHDLTDYRERLYLLYVFQLAFSSQYSRNRVYARLADWPAYAATLPADAADFDWRTFQQEYRDYLDLAKLGQLLPVVGAAVGVVVNYRLLSRLARTARNAYRMRWLEEGARIQE